MQRIALGAGALLLFLGLLTLNAFNLQFLNPKTTAQTVVFTALSAFAFVIFVAALLLLARNVLKLYAEQKSSVMGSRLRTRMLVGAVLVSLLPICFMFAFSYLLLNRAVDRWFSQPVTQIREDSSSMAASLGEYTATNASVEAQAIGAALPRNLAPSTVSASPAARTQTDRVLAQHEVTLQGGFAVVFLDAQPLAALNLPRHTGAGVALKPWNTTAATSADDIPEPSPAAAAPVPHPQLQGREFDPADPALVTLRAAAHRGDRPIFSLAGVEYALGEATLARQGTGSASVVVGLPLPAGMSSAMLRLQGAANDYWIQFRARRSVRSTYMILLLMMTALALFASTWLALHLSKQVTRPVEELADAMALIAAGNYAHRVRESATDELGELVSSFNHMAEDLDHSRAQVEAGNRQLSAMNAALEARSGELETMLETIPNGVATLSADGRLLAANRALSELVDPGGRRPFIGQRLAEVFPPDMMETLDRLMQRSHRMGTANAELETDSPATGPLHILATVAILEVTPRAAAVPTASAADRREHVGYVLVLENATELLRAQKQSAWKEVARRVAHEIKNPLTPISLSAEQIARHVDRLEETLTRADLSSRSTEVIRRSSEVISTSVESMRSLVDQFASLAQFPTAQPRPADLNTIVENSLALFAGRMQRVRLVRRLAPGLPLVLADPEAMKRALSNVIDNAVEAMQHSLLRELRISTALVDSGMVELTVADTGTGLTDEMRERLFLPYFSTKQRGTGLGLAIAAKIVQEHGGSIRAEKNEPAGARFLLELRPASMPEDNSRDTDDEVPEPASEPAAAHP